MKIPFTKYQGAGNDFVILDFSSFSPNLNLELLSRHLCDRRMGIGADGLILLLPSEVAHYKMRIFNADGSEPTMCGNGIRCLFDFIQSKECNPLIKIETGCGILVCQRKDTEISIHLGIGKVLHWPILLFQEPIFVVDTGVPHAVVFVENLDEVAIVNEGVKIRFHPHFMPQGVNVNFVQVDSSERIFIRTYERGVEAETLACGTGAAAAALVAFKRYHLSSPIRVFTRLSFIQKPIEYQQALSFQLNELGDQTQIEMLGKVQHVFEGFIDIRPYYTKYHK